MLGARGQKGQATVEWVGLLLAVGLMLGALAGGVRGATRAESGEGARELGRAVAKRITCAARDLCGAAEPARGERGSPRDGALLSGGAPHREAAPGGEGRTAPRPLRSAPPPPRAVPRSGPLPNLGRAGSVAEHAWIACLGYRSLRDDLDHPRSPREARPVERTLDIVNECLNPWEFFFGD
jgi:hypothetical protein